MVLVALKEAERSRFSRAVGVGWNRELAGLLENRHNLENCMQAMRNYEWATDAVEKVTKQHRESQACERRLRQMAAKREKEAKRAAARKAAEGKVTA